MPNKLSLSVQYPDTRLREIVARPQLRRWVKAALQAPAELTIRFVDANEGRILNRDYRHKDYPTNILTFAYGCNQDEVISADLILCTDVLIQEAQEQAKTIPTHAAHLVVHGVLHAQGYDHENEQEAMQMEQLEITIMRTLGYPNPYVNLSSG